MFALCPRVKAEDLCGRGLFKTVTRKGHRRKETRMVVLGVGEPMYLGHEVSHGATDRVRDSV